MDSPNADSNLGLFRMPKLLSIAAHSMALSHFQVMAGVPEICLGITFSNY